MGSTCNSIIMGPYLSGPFNVRQNNQLRGPYLRGSISNAHNFNILGSTCYSITSGPYLSGSYHVRTYNQIRGPYLCGSVPNATYFHNSGPYLRVPIHNTIFSVHHYHASDSGCGLFGVPNNSWVSQSAKTINPSVISL